MIRKVLIVILLPVMAAVSLLAAATPASAPAPLGGRTASWDSYRLIVQRNIFSKNRQAYVPRDTRSYTPSAYTPRDSDSYVILTGIVTQEGEPMAFVEDTRSGQTARAGVGQKIGSGRITAINAASIRYQSSTASRTVFVGESLAGAPAYVTEPVASTAPGTTSAPAAATSAPAGGDSASRPALSTDPSTLSVEERMRLRRLQGN